RHRAAQLPSLRRCRVGRLGAVRFDAGPGGAVGRLVGRRRRVDAARASARAASGLGRRRGAARHRRRQAVPRRAGGPWQPVPHRLVHRRRRAAVAGRLLRAGAAEPQERAAGGGNMTAMKTLLRWLGAALAALAALTGAAAPGGSDLALQGSGPYYTLHLTMALQGLAATPELRDMQVVNSRCEALPFAWPPPRPDTAEQHLQAVPHFKLPGAASGGKAGPSRG